MRKIFKNKRTHKDNDNRVKYNTNTKSDIKGHVKIKDNALMDYYMMGGY